MCATLPRVDGLSRVGLRCLRANGVQASNLSIAHGRWYASKGRRRSSWTIEEIERLKTLRMSGKSFEEIATLLKDRTVTAVKHRWYTTIPRDEANEIVDRYGPRPKWSTEEKAMVSDMHSAGLSHVEIASRLPPRRTDGYIRPPEQVFSLIAQVLSPAAKGLTSERRWKAFTTEETKEIIRLHQEAKLSYSQIASRFGRSISSIRSHYARHAPPGDSGALRKHDRWTPEELAQLKSLRESDASMEQLGRAFPNRSRPALIAAGMRFGMTEGVQRERARWRRGLFDLRSSGTAWNEIALLLPSKSLKVLQNTYYRMQREGAAAHGASEA